MPDPACRTQPNPLPPIENEAFHRLTARLATLDLDPGTVEILTAVLTVDLDLITEDAHII